jgi:hypothetical protein
MTNNRAWVVWQRMDNVVSNPPWRSPGRAIGALLVMLGMVLASSSVAEAREAPKQTGPLNFDERQCATDTVRKRIEGRLEVVAKAETCLLFYTYDPEAEDNEERDYGIGWVQARIDPRGAWCAKDIWSDLVVDVSEDTRMHKRTPDRNFKLGRSRRIEFKLVSFANGSGDRKATLSETTRIYPRRLRHRSFPFEGSRVFRQRWTGQRGGVINLTSGAELSWRENEPGPDAISSQLLYDFERRGTC